MAVDCRPRRAGPAAVAALFLAIPAASGAAAARPAAPNLGIEQQQAFVLADTNHDNCLQLTEVAAVMASRFAALDRDRDQRLSAAELPADMAQHLARLDADGDGQLTFIEVMTAKEADFTAADRNGDGCIAIDELVVFDRQPAGGSP